MTTTTPTDPVNAPVGPSTASADRPAGFADLGVSEPVVAALARRGIRAPFAIQSLVLADAIAGRDVLARSSTGSGKTLAFAVPAVERLSRHGRPGPLVLVPTRELTTHVAEEFRAIAEARGLSVATVYGGVGIAKQVRAATRADIVVATPGRLLDLLQRRLLRLNRVGICVLDEADRMLDMGFLRDVTTVLSVLPSERQTMLFSATLDGDVSRLAARFTIDPVRHEVAERRAVVSAAVHRFVAVDAPTKVDTLTRELAAERSLALVFVRTKRGAARLARSLAQRAVPAEALHGDMSQGARERALARFASGRIYVHRVGRTARAGRIGVGVTFVTGDQQPDMARLCKMLDLDREFTAAYPPARSAAPASPARRGRPRHRRGRKARA